MPKPKILVFIVAYNASPFIHGVLDRIQDEVWQNQHFDTEVLIIDDHSPDDTFHVAHAYTAQHPELSITVLHNPVNQGYGGNQKLGYFYAIQNGFDAVILLHGDGQYPSEAILPMVEPILAGQADAVFGSRMINKRDALKGKMPLYKWVGNQILTTLQNTILGANLSEFHTGYRAYAVAALGQLPFKYNSNYFDFDTDIIIQFLNTKKRIHEIAIPTRYGEEESRVNGWRYGALILLTSLRSRLVPFGLFYHPKFDYSSNNTVYTLKLGYASSHQYALDGVQTGERVLELGGGAGFLVDALREKAAHITTIDRQVQPLAQERSDVAIQSRLEDFDFADAPEVDIILLLDVLSELSRPEAVLEALRQRYGNTPARMLVSTGNTAFFLVRLNLLLGRFNYSRRGMLNLNNKFLFTEASLRRLLDYTGFNIVRVRGVPLPTPLVLGDNRIARLVLALNLLLIRLSRSLFAYQLMIEVQPKPTLGHLLADAEQTSQQLLSGPPQV